MRKTMLSLVACGIAFALQSPAQTSTATSPQSTVSRANGPAQGTVSAPNTALADPQVSVATGPVKFPSVDPKNFTAATPTQQTVDGFLRAVWGADENREWRVASIQPATSPGFVKVEVYVADKRQPGRIGTYNFLVTPDGKHAVSGDLSPFGSAPFAENRAFLQQHADGPTRGAATKDLELVEFADLQSPNSKAAEATVDQLAKDFPQAHVVFQFLPQPGIHPLALQAAEVGFCVRQAKGDPAFYLYAHKVYDTQADLNAEKGDATLRAAVSASGADPVAIMACSTQAPAKAAVEASVKLASELGINTTPTLVINGRVLPLTQVPYASLKKLVVYQGQLDGMAIKEQPSLTSLH